MKALEKGLSSKSRKQREQASQEQSRSSVSASSNHAAESGLVPVNSSGVSLVQSNTLFGLGQNPQLLESISTSASDPQSLAADPLAGIQAQWHTPLLPNSVEFSRLFGANPYESYQDGQILALGVLRQYYICQHLDGLCDQNFESPEALEEHFESAHFTFARLDPPYRYICSNCQYWNTCLNSRCQQCRANGAIEVWIYGNFIRTSYYPRYPPDSHDPFKIEIPSLHELSSTYDTPATDSKFGGGPGGIAGFTGGLNQGGYTYNYQNHNIYPAPNSPSHGFGAYGPSQLPDSNNSDKQCHSPPTILHSDPIHPHTSPHLPPSTLSRESRVQCETDSTLSEEETDWEDDGIPGLPEDPDIFEHIYDVLHSKDLLKNETLIGPILDPGKRAIIEHIMKDFWQIFDQEWSAAIRKYAGTPCTANSFPYAQASNSSASKLSEKTNKRTRNNDDRPPDEGRDGSHKRSNNHSSFTSSTEETRNFACPYRKRNARIYNHHSLKWRTCALTPLQTVARVKYASSPKLAIMVTLAN